MVCHRLASRLMRSATKIQGVLKALINYKMTIHAHALTSSSQAHVSGVIISSDGTSWITEIKNNI